MLLGLCVCVCKLIHNAGQPPLELDNFLYLCLDILAVLLDCAELIFPIAHIGRAGLEGVLQLVDFSGVRFQFSLSVPGTSG